MRNTKNSLINVLKQECTKKVRICTMKFCAEGCLVENYDDDNIVCLSDADVSYTDGSNRIEKRNNICICDNNIIAFEAIHE